MADGHGHSRYVKLTKDQAPVDDITPGGLNQPIQVPQLNVHRCVECGLVLPESYEPPADEDWATGIFGCFEDAESCYKGFFCPCVLFGRNIETLRDDIPWTNACVCHAMCIEGGMALAAATALFLGIDPRTSFLICESLFFTWWMCGIYTGLFRQSLQKKYHLKTINANQGGELDTMDRMAPLDVVVKILNNQLGSLMWIDEKTEELSSRIQKLATQGSAADRELMGPKFWMS